MTRGGALLAWHRSNARKLPWRGTRDPYRILVSEVMLQQTQVRRVIPAYERFLDAFPTVDSLAAADLDGVLAAWSGLGYNTRARRLRDAARIVVRDGWPADSSTLEALPGVGKYTAVAVASLAFGERVAVDDTNARRVLSRWEGEPLTGAGLRAAAALALFGDPAAWNQAIMDLGAVVCRPTPDCSRCPVTRWCADPSVYRPPIRQTPFRGSDREVRGAVLRALSGRAWRADQRIAKATGHDIERVRIALRSLADDALVELRENSARIAR